MISLVIPVYNRAELVVRTLNSVAGQTLMPDKIVLVDNNSTDSSLSVLQQWAAERENVEVISCTTPGAAAARNAGLTLVDTPYVMFFDSDDYMPPRHVEEIDSALRQAGMPKIGAFDMTLVDVQGKSHLKDYRHGDVVFNQLFHSSLSTQRCVVNTEFLRSVGAWNESVMVWNDYELGTRLVAACPHITYISLSEPPIAYAQERSITGTEFSSKVGAYEHALDLCEQSLRNAGKMDYLVYVDYRRAILAGMYIREGHRELAMPLLKSFKMRMVARFTALGGRGVAQIARLLR